MWVDVFWKILHCLWTVLGPVGIVTKPHVVSWKIVMVEGTVSVFSRKHTAFVVHIDITRFRFLLNLKLSKMTIFSALRVVI